ncbi:MAG: hypothetical protein JWP27_91 [Flaviaesturariibacter sp.]|nr:hypothetical protein [Flaviaesturariibacter sp.]
METTAKTSITIQAVIAAPADTVWKAFTTPADIMQWNNASPDWYTPSATNDLRVGGIFTSRMAARDGSMAFDFAGVYDEVETNKRIAYTIGDGRKVSVDFIPTEGGTRIVETFEAESTHSIDMQRGGWQAILDNFKSYVEVVNGG